jgi:polar amino acid transport system substrate-binding protein
MVRASGMRRAIAGALLATLASLLAACGGGGPDASGAAGDFTPGTPGVLTVATADVPTPGFWEGTAAHPTGGFEWALAHELARRFGLAAVKVVELRFEQITGGDLGGADLALAQVTPTDRRAEHLDFSTPYLPAPPGVLVRAGTDVPDLQTAQDLTWAVQHGTTLEDALDEQIRPDAAPLVLERQSEVLDALRGRQVDAILLDLPTALAYADGSGGALEAVAQLPSESKLAAALPKGSDNLEAVDSELHALSADGTLRDLAERWLGTSIDGVSADQVPLLRTSL